ncbi:C-type lectin domain family 4 member G [Austrofundulus limnaeus]|uniref:C-type lectin domain family 4 member G n=1 Tax=Austrofundulus limnaeus TaxID=52670 RepID=A0A2I4D5U5_AUSLI|nr:PREDICTED: C-type lectin domain family 4 member G-like [Austrofundulus limnaeus]
MSFCLISMLAIIGVFIYEKQELKKQVQELKTENKNLTKQVQELQTENKNLTDQVETMPTPTNELNVSRAQWSINTYCRQRNDKTCKACQDGWSSFQSSCYAYNDAPPADQLSWEEARENCRGKSSYLTVVAEEAEKNHVSGISNAKPGINGYWIGLRAAKGKWKWIDGSDVTNDAWISSPTNSSQCVISVKDQGWKTVSCENKNGWK